MPSRILVAEDQKDISELIAVNLRSAGYEVHCVADGTQALAAARSQIGDLLILDLIMPGLDGLEVCKALRIEKDSRPILMLTAKSSEFDRILGLELGADDYLTKPFSLPELLARVKALLRRSDMMKNVGRQAHESAAELPVRTGALEILPTKRQVFLRSTALVLTALEFDLLLFFAQSPGHVFSRSQLLDAVWGYSHDGYEHTVTTHINRLRGKLEANPLSPEMIVTVRGAGYKLQEQP